LSGALQARSEFRRTGPRQVDTAESAPRAPTVTA